MRTQWIVSILSILVSMGLLMIVMSQYQVLFLINKTSEKLQLESEGLGRQLINEDLFKTTVEKLLVQGVKVVEDQEVKVTQLRAEMEKKTMENNACQAEMKTKADELAGTEKEHTETEATFKAESDSWNQEITILKAQLTGYRPICDYVKKDPQKLCGTNTPEPEPQL